MQHTGKFQSCSILSRTFIPDKQIGMGQSVASSRAQQDLFHPFLSYDTTPAHERLTLERMPDPEVDDPVRKCFSEEFALSDPLRTGWFSRIVNAKAIVNSERTKECIVPEAHACRKCDVLDPEIM